MDRKERSEWVKAMEQLSLVTGPILGSAFLGYLLYDALGWPRWVMGLFGALGACAVIARLLLQSRKEQNESRKK